MKIIFMGTPVFSTGILERLIKEFDVLLVVTQPDKKVGRKRELKPTPVKEVALKFNIEVLQPNNIPNIESNIKDLNPDFIITAAYGQIIPESILNIPKYGSINVHGSLLPKFRGGAPIHKAITSGEKETGVTIMYMAKKMDAGDIISKKSFTIEDNYTLQDVHDKMMLIGTDLLLKTIPKIINGTANRIKQNENDVSYAYNIKRSEEKINLNTSCKEIYNHVRGFNPWPVAYVQINDKVLKVFNISYEICELDLKIGEIYKKSSKFGVKVKDGIIYLEDVQLSGKKRMLFDMFLNGNMKLFEEGNIIT